MTPTAPAAAPEAPKPLKIAGYEFPDENSAKAEIERGRQSGRLLTEAQKRLVEASKKEKDFEGVKGEAKKDFLKATAALGLSREEAVELASKFLWEHEVKPKQMSPEQRRIRELEAEKAEREGATKAEAEKAKAAQQEQATVEESKKLRREIEAVLTAKKVPGTRHALKRVASYLSSYAEAGADVPVEVAAEMAMGDYKQEFGELFDDASPEQLEEFLGKERWQKIARKVSDWALAKARGKIPGPPQEVVTRGKPVQKEEGKMTPQEFQKFMKGVK
ncbi:MAG: hypothetical protein IPJ65_38300 [Archangiaceae bacterium]|nr:hypothetical protein [Archangiaceae bacterium]